MDLFIFQMTGATPYFAAAFVGGLFIVVGMVSSIFMLRHIKSTGVTVWKAFVYRRSLRPQYNTRIVFLHVLFGEGAVAP